MYVNTITVLMQAIRSASASELPDFSPNAFAQIRHVRLVISFSIKYTIKDQVHFAIVNYTVERTIRY